MKVFMVMDDGADCSGESWKSFVTEITMPLGCVEF